MIKMITTVTVDDGVKVKMACYKFVALKKSIKQTNKTKQNKIYVFFMSLSGLGASLCPTRNMVHF